MVLHSEEVKHQSGDNCPSCYSKSGGKLVAKKVRGGKMFWLGCSRYPNCKYSLPARLTKDNERGLIQKIKKEYAKWEKKAGLSKQEKKEYGDAMRFIRGL